MTPRRQSADPLERYDTPVWVSRALLDVAVTLQHMRVIEPMAGAAAMSRVLAEEGHCRVQAFDIDPRHASVAGADSLEPGFWQRPDLGLDDHRAATAVITNPPFSRAADLVRLALTADVGVVAIVARLSFLEACEGRDDLPAPDALIVVPRPRFTGTGNDSVTVAWFVWNTGRGPDARGPRGIYRLARADKARLEAGAPAVNCWGCPVSMGAAEAQGDGDPRALSEVAS